MLNFFIIMYTKEPLQMKKIFQKFISYFSKKFSTNFLGSKYGGWDFIETESLMNATIISAGVGTDVSFDIEIMQKYKTKVIFIDPTPTALDHLKLVLSSIGNHSTIPYSNDGKQKINSYNLNNLKKENFIIEKKALYNLNNKNIKFYQPINLKHVSHSISNWQNNYSKNSAHIVVNTINLKNIIKKYKLQNIEMIKLDIEGAEFKVLLDLLRQKIKPKQILVEFDELQTNKLINYLKYFFLILKLFLGGYTMIETKKYPNFLFINRSNF